MSWRDDWRRVRAVALKDLTAERRSKSGLNAVTFLGVLVLMLFGFALGPDTESLREAATGAIWLAILFSGVLAFNRSYQLELDGGALEPLLLYPGSRWSIFAGKLLANLAFVGLVELIVIPVALVLFHVSIPDAWAAQLGVTLLGTIGFVTLGTFYAAMSSRSRSREVLLPLLLFPMMIPVLLGAVEASTSLLEGNVMRDAGAWIRMLLVYDVVFLAAALAVFEFVIEV
ncbi:MAG: heme exporter protein CcmB [Gemmatimonadetes bacterium]|jgi:heme exporter protein B|nr:heme exporter protein CcmB [Gemmatimonadota bacterium]